MQPPSMIQHDSSFERVGRFHATTPACHPNHGHTRVVNTKHGGGKPGSESAACKGDNHLKPTTENEASTFLLRKRHAQKFCLPEIQSGGDGSFAVVAQDFLTFCRQLLRFSRCCTFISFPISWSQSVFSLKLSHACEASCHRIRSTAKQWSLTSRHSSPVGHSHGNRTPLCSAPCKKKRACCMAQQSLIHNLPLNLPTSFR